MLMDRRTPWLHCMAALVAGCIGLPGSAQETAAREHFIHNTTVFVEAWGEGIYNSLNIEKTMTTPSLVNYHVRLGFGYWQPGNDPVPVNFFSLPVDAAISYGRDVKVELSLGATPFWFSTDKDDLVSSVIAPTFGLHLRVQPPEGGLFLRLGALIAPMAGLNNIPGIDDPVEKGTWAWSPGVGMGYTF